MQQIIDAHQKGEGGKHIASPSPTVRWTLVYNPKLENRIPQEVKDGRRDRQAKKIIDGFAERSSWPEETKPGSPRKGGKAGGSRPPFPPGPIPNSGKRELSQIEREKRP